MLKNSLIIILVEGQMSRFRIVRKGYDTAQVSEYLSKLIDFTEGKLAEQRKRIEDLKHENRELKVKYDQLKLQEDAVSEALINATKKADDIVKNAKIQYALESERLKLFKERWTNYILEARKEVVALDKTLNIEAYLTKMDDEISSHIGRNLNIRKERILNEAENQFLNESARLKLLDIDEDECESLDKNEPVADIENNGLVIEAREIIQENVDKVNGIDFSDKEIERDRLKSQKRDDDEINDFLGGEKKINLDIDMDASDEPLDKVFQDLGLID